jgi:hypothetical protein
MATANRRQATAGTANKLAILRRHSLFGQLSPAMTEHLGSYMKRRRLPRGTVIFAKGDPGTGLMGVLAGEVKISVPSADGREIVLTTMHEGDIFGEIALLDGHPRTADATAITDCELMVIERRDFIPFLHSQPDVTLQIIEILCSPAPHNRAGAGRDVPQFADAAGKNFASIDRRAARVGAESRHHATRDQPDHR